MCTYPDKLSKACRDLQDFCRGNLRSFFYTRGVTPRCVFLEKEGPRLETSWSETHPVYEEVRARTPGVHFSDQLPFVSVFLLQPTRPLSAPSRFFFYYIDGPFFHGDRYIPLFGKGFSIIEKGSHLFPSE